MKTKYVCHGLIYLHVNFHDNRTMQTVILIIKNCRWGGRKKSQKILQVKNKKQVSSKKKFKNVCLPNEIILEERATNRLRRDCPLFRIHPSLPAEYMGR